MAVGVAYLMNMGIPRSGEISRALVLKKYEGVPFEKSFGTIIAERVADFIILSTLVIIALFSQFETLKDYLLASFKPEKIVMGIAGILVLGVLFFFVARKSNNPIIKKIKDFVIGIKDGAFSIIHMENKWGFIGHTLFIWVMYVAMFYVVKWTVPETSSLGLNAMLPAFVIGGLTISATNGGIGIYPFSVSLMLSAFGVSNESGLAFGWIMWTSQTLMILVFGSLSFFVLPLVNRKK